jgi:hypothetical protein
VEAELYGAAGEEASTGRGSLPFVSTRMLLILAAVTGVAILVAFTVQVLIAT